MEYNYNERGWLTTLAHRKSDETLIAGFAYEYDPTYWGRNGTRTAMVEDILKPGGDRIQARVDYEYDDLYRLTRELRAGSFAYDKRYSYDSVGNRLTKIEGGDMTYYHHDAGNKLLHYGPSNDPNDPSGLNTHLAYDGAGNMTSVTPPDGPTTTYMWDWMDKLTSVDQRETNIARFEYDGDGDCTSATFGSDTTSFLYDGGQVIAELDGEGNLKAFYVLGPDGAVSRLAAATAYYHGDGLWSVKAMSDGSMGVTDAYAYDAWGNDLAHFGSAQQPYQYVGRLGYYAHYQNPAFALLQLGARYTVSRCGFGA